MALQDRYTLSQDSNFRQRVQQAIILEAVQTIAEAPNTGFHKERTALAIQVLRAPDTWGILFAQSVASRTAVESAYLSVSPANQLAVTDALITGGVTAQWNAMAGAIG